MLTLAILVLSVVSFAFALVALLLRLLNDRSTKRRAELSEAWEPTMLDVLAGTSEPEQLMELVQDDATDEFLTFLLGYARRLRGEERSMVRGLAAPYLPELATRATRGSAEQRGLAVQALAGMGMPEYSTAVARALDDESPVVAMIAARGIFRPGRARHFRQVLRHLPRFTPWSRSYLASMLAGGGPEAAPMLREMLADKQQQALVRAVVADSLRALNDLPSVELAIQILEEETDRELVTGCLRLVHQLGHRDHAGLVRSFARSPDPVIRGAAVGALGAIGGKSDVPLLQDLLDDVAYWVSIKAARALMALGEIELLRRLARGGGPWSLLAQQVLNE